MASSYSSNRVELAQGVILLELAPDSSSSLNPHQWGRSGNYSRKRVEEWLLFQNLELLEKSLRDLGQVFLISPLRRESLPSSVWEELGGFEVWDVGWIASALEVPKENSPGVEWYLKTLILGEDLGYGYRSIKNGQNPKTPPGLFREVHKCTDSWVVGPGGEVPTQDCPLYSLKYLNGKCVVGTVWCGKRVYDLVPTNP